MTSRLHLVIACALVLGSLPRVTRAGCTLTTQWEWDGSVRSPSHPVPLATPLVVQLSDDNGDGSIGLGDVPDVVFTHDDLLISCSNLVTALDGRDGSELFTSTTRVYESLAAGDLDGDGVVELVGFGDDQRSIVVLRHDGSLAWRLPFMFPIEKFASINLADIDADGSPDIYFNAAVHSADGSMRWQGTRSRSNWGSMNVAVDLLPGSPGLELIASNICYAADGGVLWDRSYLSEAHPSVGDLDGDGSAEVILVGKNLNLSLNWIELNVLARDGAELGSLVNTNRSLRNPGPAALADLDGDGRLEVIVPMGDTLDAYTWTGTELVMLWSSPATDRSGLAGVSVFDMDGDGVPEVLYRGDHDFYVIDGRNGAVLDSKPHPSVTAFETPVVADIDADGIPEIVVSGGDRSTGGYVTAYTCGVAVPSRCIWNQQAYHVTNVDDAGTLPRVEVAPWTMGLGWLEQEGRSCCRNGGAPQDVTLCAGGSTTLDASSLADPGCPGGSTFTWRDALGGVIGTSATVVVAPSATTSYSVTVECAGRPVCRAGATIQVTVDLAPLFTTLRARDPDTCNLGIELTWDAATFLDPSGTGVYDVYRSEVSCLDAMAQPPMATGVSTLSFVDRTTQLGHSYFYVVQAEDARLMTPCAQGPHHGGAVNAGLVCVGPVLESSDAYTPELLGWALRARHVGDVVTMAWPGSRALLPGEHFHVLKSYGEVGFARVNLEGDLSTTWIESDTSRPLQFFDVRIATPCEIQSLDDEPPG